MKQLSIILFWVIGFSVFAQNVKRFRHLTINDGLAHTDAICFEQDDLGFIWIGTNSGLNKYDGRKVYTYKNNIHQTHQVYSNRIWSLCKHKNYLWIGTERGLQLFFLNKEKFKIYTVSGPAAALSQSIVMDIVCLDDVLLVRSSNGLFFCTYDEKENRLNIQEAKEILNYTPEWFDFNAVKTISTDKENRFWIGSDKGILSCSKKDGEFVVEKGYLENNNSIGIKGGLMYDIEYWDNRLWVSKGKNIHILSLNSQTHLIRNSLGILNVNNLYKEGGEFDQIISVSKLLIDEYENLWGSTKDGLLLIEDPLSENVKAKLIKHSEVDPLSLATNHLTNLFVDKTNCLWVGSWGGGVSILNLEQKKFNLLKHDIYSDNTSLSSPFVRAINEDSLGFVWIGNKDAGIDIYNPKTQTVVPLNKLLYGGVGLNSNEIRAITPHKDVMFIGTTAGLNEVNIHTYKVKKYATSANGGSLPNFAVFTIAIDKHSQVWCGTWGGGIAIIKKENNQEKFIHLNRDTEFALTSNTITNLLFDGSRNVMYAASNKGLNEIILDENGNVKDIIYYREHGGPGSLTGEYLWPMLKESDSVLWIGSLGGGLNRMVIKLGEASAKQGLYQSKSFYPGGKQNVWDIESLLQDNRGNLWLGGKGITKFNIKTGEFWQFDVNDGLQSDGFKIGSAFKSKDGTLYFGGIKGLNFFKPSQIKANSFTPVAALTSFAIQNKEIKAGQEINKRVILENVLAYTKEIKLNYLENDFSISFSALHYANPAKCKFKYMLEGYDPDWVLVDQDYPVANYSNLKYGDYHFKVLASNNDGKFSDKPTILKIHVDAPWWLSYKAIIVYILLVSFMLFSFYYYQSKMLTLRNNIKLIEAEEVKKEELHQMKLQFFTNISHEFKTPLTLILSPIEKLLNTVLPEKEQKELLKMIDKNARRMLNLVTELMDFRKAEVGKMNMRVKEYDLKSIVNDVVGHYLSYSESKKVKINVKADETNVFVDSECAMKIFNNLISNALKFTSEEGDIQIEVFKGDINNIKLEYKYSHQIISEVDSREFAIFRIEDSGIGITKDSIKQVFDRFYNVNEKTQPHVGTGIGLALVKSLVSLHKGSIFISSERNKGTEIIVAFPLGTKHIDKENIISSGEDTFLVRNLIVDEFAEDENQEVTESIENEFEQTLLIVEDNQELRKLLLEHFKNDFTVFEAENGRIGVELALNEIPDIIISDIMMPEMDGLELCKILKQDLKTSHIPVVLLTAKSSIENQIEGVESGADAYIPKPFSMRLLDAKIEALLSHYKAIKEKYASDVFASTREIVKNKKDQDFVDDLIELIDKNMDNNEFSVNILCKELGIGRTNLYKKIKSLTDQSLGEFIRMLRLKKAAKILVSEDVSITEVIYRVGINSNSYFTKAFKAQFGITPSEFVAQKSNMKNDNLEGDN